MSSTRTPQWNLIRLMLYSALVATVYSSCSEPLHLTFALHNGTKDNYTAGETVIYSCKEGYNTNPSVTNVSTCGPDGAWSPILPDLCRRICPQPENLTNAFINTDPTTYEEGDNVIYSCLPDYKYIPPKNNASTCGVNGTWSPFEENFCAKLQCDIPDILENGNVAFEDSVFGSIASYTCLKGYKLFGDDKRQCSADEKWSGTVPLCNRTCSEPPTINFTTIDPSTSSADGYYPQSTQVTYTCISGFEPSTLLPSFTICQSDFTWTHIAEFCMRISCGSPGTLENGKVVKENDKFQSKAEFVCDEGYMLVGNKNRECLEDRSWSGSVPTCNRSCPDPPTLNSSEIISMPDIGYFEVGIIIAYKCLPGYKYDPFLSPTIQCLQGFTWSNVTEFCKKLICGEPEKIKNGNLKTSGTDFGSVVKYSCNEGFTMTGNAKRRCTEDGVWEGSPPMCQ